MILGTIVYYPYNGDYIKYRVIKSFDGELIVKAGNTFNWLPESSVISEEEFNKMTKDYVQCDNL